MRGFLVALVELIVLNVGLSAGILTQRVFSMFVLEALTLTFLTTPTVVTLYPPEMRVRAAVGGPHARGHASGAAVVDAAEKGTQSSTEKSEGVSIRKNPLGDDGDERKTRFTIVLDKVEHLPGMMALTQLIQPPPTESPQVGKRKSLSPSLSTQSALDKEKEKERGPPALARHEPSAQDVSIDALRLIELSDRTSAVMRSSNADTLINTDPLLNIFSTFGDLNGINVSSSLAIVMYDDLASSVVEHAQRHRSQLVLVPWLPPHHTSESAPFDGAETAPVTPRTPTAYMQNPFEALFRATNTSGTQSASALHSHLVRGVFAQARTDVALYIDRHHPGEGRLPMLGSMQHIFLPFFGGPDDRLALQFLVQLCTHPRVTATAVRFIKREFDELRQMGSLEKPQVAHLGDERPNELTVATVSQTTAFPDTVYGAPTTQTRLQSETADNVAWSRYSSYQGPDDGPFAHALSPSWSTPRTLPSARWRDGVGPWLSSVDRGGWLLRITLRS
ncbi:predicted protein [Postia placenta Mad-698-R]|uniref:Uncharacterized protein n=1 Tax=Postia placenta MAD-698-R-SB12 TaxID=670580 RepID=A0A1X6MJ82_9APHY|nr:hypothetical protein POSPLADRAFT_1160141 [Postia placenta MAD-698-R-SB12]EED80200.1 predicted protein [Postia placenta Mad-698-R]OSX56405.1 hypothetical protein POSPLADRAFT_1160141 [Postia placenta MAD-698-R-SB12]